MWGRLDPAAAGDRGRVARPDGRPVQFGSSVGRTRCRRRCRCRSWCGCGLGARRSHGAAGGPRRSAQSTTIGTATRTGLGCEYRMGDPLATVGDSPGTRCSMTCSRRIGSCCRPCVLRSRHQSSIRSIASDPSRPYGRRDYSFSRSSVAWRLRPNVPQLRPRPDGPNDSDDRNRQSFRRAQTGSPGPHRPAPCGSDGSVDSGETRSRGGLAVATARAFSRL